MNKNRTTYNPGWMGGGAQSVDKYVPRGGPDWGSGGDAAKAMAIAPVAAASTNPQTRAPEVITNSGPVTGGIVDTENRAGGRKRRMRSSAYASQELLG
jgi:GTPase involved in cell partitioning and DNA repair